MQSEPIQRILEQVAQRRMTVPQALKRLKHFPFENLNFAKIDHHRHLRQGFPEVVFGSGKTPAQLVRIARGLARHSQPLLITRVSQAAVRGLRRAGLKVTYDKIARCAMMAKSPLPKPLGKVVIATAGTADIPVAAEAAVAARWLGAKTEKLFDVGVAGFHRLLAYQELLQNAKVVIVIAGMEGALASVVGGLTPCPVIAVPTSIGYGSAFAGMAALLTMLNSCAPNVAVVNIDNGFGAGFLAGLINRLACQSTRRGSGSPAGF